MRFDEVLAHNKSWIAGTKCYAVQDKVWVKDPDGNDWEVFVVKADTEVMQVPTAQAKADAPCCAPSCCAPSATADAAR